MTLLQRPTPEGPRSAAGTVSVATAAPLFVSSDNGLGSPFGDVDDAFAIAALLRGGAPIAALASVFGNTSERRAAANHARLAALCGYAGPLLRGAGRRRVRSSEAARALAGSPTAVRVLALGPLTDVAAAIDLGTAAVRGALAEVIAVGGNRTSHGRWPPVWPHEFNFTQDLAATRALVESDVPWTILPLDVTRRLRAGPRDLAMVGGAVGDYLRRGARRWLWRARLLKGSNAFPVWDLVAALYALDPAPFRVERDRVTWHRGGWLEFGRGSREVSVVAGFDPIAAWRRAADLLGR